MDKLTTRKKATSTEKKEKKPKKIESLHISEGPEEVIPQKKGESKQSNGWQFKETVLFKDFGTSPSKKILCFDLDETIIQTKSGSKFAKNENDWKLLHTTIPDILEKYIKDGFKIVFFTNQGGISKGKTDEGQWKNKVDAIQKALNLPVQVFAATETDYYRKPAVGMWELLKKEFSNNLDLDLNESFYVGDAAGRPKTNVRSKDFSDSDHKFAINVGISFKTPEMFFENKKESLPKFEFDPKIFKIPNQTLFKNIKSTEEKSKLKSDKKEMIIFIGSAGSGKSTFYHTYLKPNGYSHVNQDTLKTSQKCLKVAEEELNKGKSVVIDNTNPTTEARAQYIELSKKLKIDVRAFVYNYPKDLVFHLNEMRSTNIHRDHNSKSVADVIVHTWYKKFAPPTTKEGFSEILELNFIPGPFVNSDDEKTFYNYS